MAAQISTLLRISNLTLSLPITNPTSLYQTFQSLFLIECPNEDATILQSLQLNAAFLEYLSTQRVSRVKLLLRAWWVMSLEAESEGENEKRKEKDGEVEVEAEVEKGWDENESDKDEIRKSGKWNEKLREKSDVDILDELERYISNGVRTFCVCFDGQEVEALAKMKDFRRKVDRIVEKSRSIFWPKFICQTREVV